MLMHPRTCKRPCRRWASVPRAGGACERGRGGGEDGPEDLARVDKVPEEGAEAGAGRRVGDAGKEVALEARLDDVKGGGDNGSRHAAEAVDEDEVQLGGCGTARQERGGTHPPATRWTAGGGFERLRVEMAAGRGGGGGAAAGAGAEGVAMGRSVSARRWRWPSRLEQQSRVARWSGRER